MPRRALPDMETIEKPTFLVETLPVISLAIAILALFLFAWISEKVIEQRTRNFDAVIRTTIHDHASPAITHLMFGITYMGGNGLVIASLLSLAIFLWLRWRRAALWMFINLVGTTILDLSLKYAFHRARPTPFFGPLPRTYSFPSGHALFSFCFYGVLAGLIADRIASRSLRILLWLGAALLILAIGISRVYLGVHYPSDVVGGYLAATLWVATMVSVDRLRLRKPN